MYRKIVLAAALAAAFGGAQAASTLITNGTLMATVADNGTFDTAGPMLQWHGVDFVIPGTPASWFVFDNGTSTSTSYSVTGTFAFPGSKTYPAGSAASTTTVIGDWSFTQTTAAVSANKLTVHLDITNNGKSPVTGAQFSVGIDPDQDMSALGGYSTFDTKNTILGAGGSAAVSATGARTGYTVTLANTTSAAATAVAAYIDGVHGCCGPVTPAEVFFGAQAVSFSNYVDDSINLGYKFGTIGVGDTVSIGYSYTFSAAVPEPETYALMLAGLGAIGFIARRRGRA